MKTEREYREFYANIAMAAISKSVIKPSKMDEFIDNEIEKLNKLGLIKEETPYDNVTRFEVIDGSGRILVKNNVKIELSLQDESRTLKVFVK
jgi:hypothetical protein